MKLLLGVISLLTVLEFSTGGNFPVRKVRSVHMWSEDVHDQMEELEQSAEKVEFSETIISQIENPVRKARQTGGIDFGNLPTFPSVESVTEFAMSTLDSYYAMVRGFIDAVQSGPLPYAIITPTVMSIAESVFPSSATNGSTGSQSGGGFDFSSVQPILIGIATWLVPLLIVTGLGIAVAVAFPITGLCFCCFRCCGKCGARNYMYKDKYELPKCATLSMISLSGSLFMMVGLLLGFLSNEMISTTVKSYPSTLRNALTDSVNYVNGTLNEVTHITDDGLDTVLNRITSDVRNASTTLGDPLRSALQNDINPFLGTSEVLFTNLDSIRGNMTSLNDTIQQILSLSSQLGSSLQLLENSIANLTNECMGNTTCTSLVPNFQAADHSVNIAIDTSSLDSGLATLDSINISRTRTLINSYTAIFNNISGIIDQQVSNINIPTNSIANATAIITNLIQSIAMEIGSNGTIGRIRVSVDTVEDTLLLGEQYRYMAFIILFVAILLIWVLFITGLLCGVYGYSPKALPFERSSVSNCGTRLLFLGVGICFVVCGLLLLFTTFLFALSGIGQKLCNDLAPSQYLVLERIVDDPEVWGGYTLVGSLLRSTSFNANVSISNMLRGCEANEPLHEALQASSFFDINSIVSMFSNLTSQLNLADSVNIGSSLTYTSDDFIPAATRSSFTTLSGTISPTALNLTTITQLLTSTDLNALDLRGVATNLTTLAAVFGGLGFSSAQNQTLDIRDSLINMINNTVLSLQMNIGTAQDAASSLNQTVTQTEPLVQQTFAQLDTFLNSTTPTVNNEVTEYVNQLSGYVDRFINYTVEQITSEVGRCGSLTTVYRAVHNNVCVDTVNGINGFWLSIGWCILFLVPLLITSAIITTYLRKSNSDIHSFDETDKGGKDDVISNRQFFGRRPEEERLDLNSPVQGW